MKHACPCHGQVYEAPTDRIVMHPYVCLECGFRWNQENRFETELCVRCLCTNCKPGEPYMAEAPSRRPIDRSAKVRFVPWF